jgi:hypothetical protein
VRTPHAALLLLLLSACHGAAPVTAASPLQKPSNDEGTVELAAQVDALLVKRQVEQKLAPAPIVDDARFLRRATLDLTGTLPTPEAIRAFLQDPRPDRRARAIDTLLASPAYATHLTAVWDELLMGARPSPPIVDRGAFRRWLNRRFADDVPWNQVVFDLVSASGLNSLGGEAMLPRHEPPADVDMREAQAGVNGAVNWLTRYRDAPQDLAGSTSRIFLGVQIQCAQCHDHKTEAWKQTDFRRFTAAFAKTRPVPLDVKGEMVGIRRIDVRDEDRIVRGGKMAPPEWREIAKQPPTALDGTPLQSPRPRRALAGWVVADANPWFARATVNRAWAQLTGRGFVEPVDDFRPSNPPEAPEVLEALAQDFKGHGYDLKRLLRTICLTAAYQRSAIAPEQAVASELWTRGRLRPLSAEQLLNTLVSATGAVPVLEQRAEKQGKTLAEVKFQLQRDVTFLFDVDEEGEDDSFTGTVPQALMLLNGNLVNGALRPIAGSTLDEVLALPTDAQRLELLYLRTLSRPPTVEERDAWTAEVQTAGGKKGNPRPRKELYEDLLWALLNSSELQFNH